MGASDFERYSDSLLAGSGLHQIDFDLVYLHGACLFLKKFPKRIPLRLLRVFLASPLYSIQSLLNVGDEVVGIFKSAGKANEVGPDSRCDEVGIRELAVRRGRRVETA